MKVKGARIGPKGEALGAASAGWTDTGRDVIGCVGCAQAWSRQILGGLESGKLIWCGNFRYRTAGCLIGNMPGKKGWRPGREVYSSSLKRGAVLHKVKKWKCYSLSCVWLFMTPWTVSHQAPLSMGFSRQEYWSRLLFPSPGDLSNPGIKRISCMAGR